MNERPLPLRPHILTVDDAKAVRDLVEQALQGFACDSSSATNGYNAFFAIERARPNLILLDISMPIMGGVETLQRLKAAPELTDIPVIMLTSRADHGVVPLLGKMGAIDVIEKPFGPATLLEKISRVVSLNATKS